MNLPPVKVTRFPSCALLAAAAAALMLSSCVTPPPPLPGPPFAPAPPRYGHQGTQSPSYPRSATPGEQPPTINRDPANTNVDITPPPPRDSDPTSPAPLPPLTSDAPPTTPPPATPPAPKPREDLPYGIPVVGKKGMVYSPFAPEKGQVDVDGYKRGTKVECPYTGKHFRVP
jgi:hypothetical protein